MPEDIQYPHYFKDVRHLSKIDVYRVVDLFEVDEEAISHAVKKLLVSGKRGAKNQAEDVKEAIKSLQRWQEMQSENELALKYQPAPIAPAMPRHHASPPSGLAVPVDKGWN